MCAEVVGAVTVAQREKKERAAPAVCRRADLRIWVLCGKSSEKAVPLIYYAEKRCNITVFGAVINTAK